MSSRDPRTNPQPGDRIHGICIGVGMPCSYKVLDVEGDQVTFTYGGNHRSTVSIGQWHRWTCECPFEVEGVKHYDSKCQWDRPEDIPPLCPSTRPKNLTRY